MAENSLIQWCDHTFNPVRGCTQVSPGCAHCYAARESVRFPNIRGIWGDSGTRILAVPSGWKAPRKWNRKAEASSHRSRVFCASLGDVFEDWKGPLHFPAAIAAEGTLPARWDGTQLVRTFEKDLPLATMDHMRLELFELIRTTPSLDWLLLTKRPENWAPLIERVLKIIESHPHWGNNCGKEWPYYDLRNWLADWFVLSKPPHNVWIGTTVENQTRADQRIPDLLDIPAVIHFLSCEPLLSHVHLGLLEASSDKQRQHLLSRKPPIGSIDWIITGGESGPSARPADLAWFRSIRDQAKEADVAFFMKQLGGVKDKRGGLSDFPEDLRIRQFPSRRHLV